MDNFRNRFRIEFLTKDLINAMTLKLESKLTFSGIHKSFANYYSYTFNQNEVLTNTVNMSWFCDFGFE